MWHTLTCDIRGGHTIASDGELYLCDDTDYNAIRVFKKRENSFYQTQILGQIGTRPHFIFYNNDTKRFYALSSLGGDFWILANEAGVAKIERHFVIDEIKDAYVRSFSFIDGFLYLISGNGFIWKIELSGGYYRVAEKFLVPDEICGMNYLMKIDDWFYITSYQDKTGAIVPNFIRVRDLHTLTMHEYEALYEKFGFKGTPYYITSFDDRFFVTEIDQASGVKSFRTDGDKIYDIRTLFFFNGHTPESEKRKMEKY